MIYILIESFVLFCFVLFDIILKGLAAWEEGKAALNEYIRIADDGLMLELNKIEPI